MPFIAITREGFPENNSEITNYSKPTSTTYFDKAVWKEYVSAAFPNLPDSLEITSDEPKNILKAYYRLLGVDTGDEYGWICEYSTVGMPPGRREAAIALRGGPDLLIRILHYPNIQTQLYAADALIYYDYETQKMIEQQKELLKKSNSKSTKDFIEDLQSELLDRSVWQQIYNLRDSRKTVKSCGNSGACKIYESNTADLLSEEAITNIPDEYEALKEMGYFSH